MQDKLVIKDVVLVEMIKWIDVGMITKWIDVGMINQISDKKWVRLVQCVLIKEGMTIIPNENTNLILTTKLRMVIMQGLHKVKWIHKKGSLRRSFYW